jgi:uncharacterized repeat protein (TIGR01451 family)
MFASPGYSNSVAGYSEYYIPGNEDDMSRLFVQLGGNPGTTNTHSVINVTAWSDNTTIYYDHWEYNYEFDPSNPDAMIVANGGHVEKIVLAKAGDQHKFESSAIAVPRSSAVIAYDGGDRIYAVGGAVTVTRASWLEDRGAGNQAVAWEIYPVKPQLTTYILPFGENLNPGVSADFQKVYVLIQATEDDTHFTVDLNNDGTWDMLDTNRDGTPDTTTVTLQRGESFLLDSNNGGTGTTGTASLNTGTLIKGDKTLQLKFIAGRLPTIQWAARGFSAFPRGYWTKDYYAALDQRGSVITDYYLYNPNTSSITVSWSSLSSSGSFSIPPNTTVSFRANGGTVPSGSGIYFSGSDVFWGVGSSDAGQYTYEWGYSLLPSTMLYKEHFLGWAPGSLPIDTSATNPGQKDDVGVFLTVPQDNTRVFVDINNDGIPEQTYTLNRLQTQFIYNSATDGTGGDMSRAHFWATGPFTMAYGENPASGTTGNPAMDLGYVAIPGTDFVSLVLTVSKSVSPQVVATASGSVATFTVKVNSQKYTLDGGANGVTVTDYLPANWQYLTGTDTATITWPDKTTHSADPSVSGLPATGQTLSWTSAQLGTDGTPGMAENEEVTITFTARTTAVLPIGTLSQNNVKAIGKRTFGTPSQTQTFTTTDFVYVASGEMTVTKTSSATNALYPGDQFTYTVTATNPASATANQTGVSIYDPLPAGLSYMAGSGSVTCSLPQNVRDQFGAVAYNNNNGSVNWSGSWIETDPGPGAAGASAGFVWITGGQLQFRYLLSDVADNFDTNGSYAGTNGLVNWSATPWVETNDVPNGSAASGSLWVNGNRLQFDRNNPGRAVSRTVTLTGATSAVITFTPTDGGIGAGETIVATYHIDALAPVTIGTYDGGTAGWSGVVQQTPPINVTGHTTLTVTFSAPGAWNANGDHAYVDNVDISFNVPANAVGSQIQRTANLTGATSPVLSFSYTPANLVAGDTLVVEASGNGGSSWTTLGTYTGGSGFNVAPPYNLTSYISINTTIRFRVTGGFAATNKSFSIDNVDITYNNPSTFASGSSPNFLSSATGCLMEPNNSLTLTYNVKVDNPLATGIEKITNTAYINSNEIILPLTASVTNTVVNPSSASVAVGDRVWLDADGDGVQDAGEPGLANVEVTLKDQYGTPLMTTTTDSTGHYLFTGVMPGNGYYVEATSSTLPSGLQQSYPSGHTDNRTDPFNIINLVSYGYNLDQFGVQAYNNSNGTVNWTSSWVESDGTQSATAGLVQVITATGDLRINGTSWIRRAFTIPAGATMATLSFDWRTTGVATTDSIALQISPDGTTYTTLQTFTNIAGIASGSPVIDISSYLAAGTTIRFYVTAGYTVANHYFFVDNVKVAYYSVLSVLNDYLDADLGYKPATGATVGSFVWSDANSNGARDAGEAGLGGVTVQLCYDANSNGILDTGEKTGCTTTTTAADGSYLFTGVTADGARDYFVYIDETQTQLSGYARSTPSPLTDPVYIQNLVSGSAYLYANYGYHSTSTYFIKDRVWFDNGAGGGTAGDGIPNGLEPGIAGVTVALLDSSLNTVATTTTDASGNFTFSGLTGGGADYTIKITDTGGILTNYYGTTASAITGTKQISNLVTNVDRTAGPGTVAVTNGSNAVVGTGTTFTNYFVVGDRITIAGVGYTIQSITDNTHLTLTTNYLGATGSAAYSAPDFGYNLRRAIGTTVFNDINGNGIQDAGELGLGGVTVKLYNDANGNGQINSPADAVIATLVTDSNGNYLFTGLNNGNYIVSIESPPSGYTYTGSAGTGNADSDPGTTGQQQAATITGGGSVLTKNFPYRASSPRSVSGTLWLDSNTNGIIDTGESKLAGVTISLYRDSNSNSVYDPGVDTLESSTTTDSNGYYSFTGLPSGTYFVIITDDSGILSGYLTSFEKTEQLTGPFNSQEVVNLSGGSLSDINFGYYVLSAPTRVTLSDFRAYEQGGRVNVRWETAYEHNTLGFNLLRQNPVTGRYEAVNSGLMPSIFKPHHGGIYTLIDGGALPGGTYTYMLIEVENTGERLSYGPFTVSIGSNIGGSGGVETVIPGPSGYDRKYKGDTEHQKAQMKTRSAALNAAGAGTITKPASSNRIKISVPENGIYYLDAGDISSFLGLSVANVSSMISRGQFSLSSQGKQAAYMPAANNAGIYFYGTGIDSIYTKENIYWLEKGNGTFMKVLSGAGSGPAPDVESFTETLHFEQNLTPVETFFNDPNADYWFWWQLYAEPSNTYTDPPKDFFFEAPGIFESQNMATIKLHLFGGSDAGVANDHHVKVILNGVLIDDYWWSALNPYTITFAASITTGVNTLTVEGIADAGVSASSVFINSFDVTYQRLYEASGDRLAFRGDGHMPVTVGGFTSPDIMVFDITNPLMPKLNAATTVGSDTTGYTVSLNPASSSTPYFSVTGRKIQRLSGKAVGAFSLSSRYNAADYIIIAPAGLISTAQVLAFYRMTQGYRTMVVDIENIMNEFNYGIPSPEAIKEFLSYAYSNWRVVPRYVVLAGDGSMDYKDNLGYGGNLIPSRMVPTPYGLFVSDNYFTDFNGDRVPEISIGRLPVVSTAELLAVIKKIKTYEGAPVNKNVVLLADAPDPAVGYFNADSELLAKVFPAGYTLKKIYLNSYSLADVNSTRDALFTAINNGAAFFNYVGHAGPNQLSNSWPGLINHYTNPEYYNDDMPLFTNLVLPVMTAMTCLVGNFSDPYQIILTEALLLKEGGGVAATWAPTGLSDDAEASILNREFYKALFISGRKPAIGDVVRKALSAYKSQGTMPFMMDIYNILGDPALRIR